MCHSPAFPTQLTRIRELAEMLGSAGVKWADEQLQKPMTCNQAFVIIQKLGKRIADKP